MTFPSIHILGVNIRESAVCADEENIYVVGGRDQPTAVKCFNVLTMSWSQIPDMPEGRRSAGVYLIFKRQKEDVIVILTFFK